jgi:hypothetical protein
VWILTFTNYNGLMDHGRILTRTHTGAVGQMERDRTSSGRLLSASAPDCVKSDDSGDLSHMEAVTSFTWTSVVNVLRDDGLCNSALLLSA